MGDLTIECLVGVSNGWATKLLTQQKLMLLQFGRSILLAYQIVIVSCSPRSTGFQLAQPVKSVDGCIRDLRFSPRLYKNWLVSWSDDKELSLGADAISWNSF